jgi:hypothetical protein
MAPTSAVKVTATKKEARKAVCEAVADKELQKKSACINNENCEIRRDSGENSTVLRHKHFLT